MNRGLLRHFLLCLTLNVRSVQALVYGYAVPVLFLLGFGSVFRSDTPPLLGEMGQLMTITILGGACFGLPTALVAERERGVWRRYRLLPVPTFGLVLGTLAARLLIVASALVLQVVLARLAFGTPLPLHPLQSAVAVVAVCLSFLGLGLFVAALAKDVPAVQALGQCLFLPMILIGGVGVPLVALPELVQKIAGFMPGRYAVEVLQHAYADPSGLAGTGFAFAALAVIGCAAAIAGAVLFRWETGLHLGRAARIWIPVALGSWLCVGTVAGLTGHLRTVLPDNATVDQIAEEEIAGVDYRDLPGDNELVSRISPPAASAEDLGRLAPIFAKLSAWPPRRVSDDAQAVRSLVCVAAIADISADPREGDIARAVFEDIKAHYPVERLRRILAWIALYPRQGKTINTAPELGLKRQPHIDIVRSRCVLYAKKYLGRLQGRLPD
ncbi:MAG: ABC transporter permease [Opitutaceae bacterium]|jgi:ABC-2 type transport system permease protein